MRNHEIRAANKRPKGKPYVPEFRLISNISPAYAVYMRKSKCFAGRPDQRIGFMYDSGSAYLDDSKRAGAVTALVRRLKVNSNKDRFSHVLLAFTFKASNLHEDSIFLQLAF